MARAISVVRNFDQEKESGMNPLSLAATAIPDCLEVSATCAEGEVMAVRHRDLPVDGVQFHPESVLTPLGPELVRNFLEGPR